MNYWIDGPAPESRNQWLSYYEALRGIKCQHSVARMTHEAIQMGHFALVNVGAGETFFSINGFQAGISSNMQKSAPYSGLSSCLFLNWANYCSSVAWPFRQLWSSTFSKREPNSILKTANLHLSSPLRQVANWNNKVRNELSIKSHFICFFRFKMLI